MAVLVVCRSDGLEDGGPGRRFALESGDEAFVIRHHGVVHAYRNHCPHRGLELDWQEGRFFDSGGEVLVCSVHGARYDPADGRCLGGPCRNRGLAALTCREQEGMVVVEEGGDER
ncbi:Rieske (2Fe-2S) protein [Acidiferrobacter thiooxydans]|uniref:Rieske (2Fe-2S) protein n=1 Tax=Acidiferrobacter thiooxydans TaxID=163359 RepID=UPI001B86C1AD|nr:Rieske (2Fe-2S) protein [Acidiferrobacter thiooxydans]MDA8118828.1 Rieske (2Fe-2S) protein [Gammaproteobacteria bacterium]MDA8189887.1 Rieske (2Fe-2S) protein [Gammaproteobacteria bacterium]UEN98475.1 Rieske (2Fe-2S) protein [Acidiferrobacter thiooxydans]